MPDEKLSKIVPISISVTQRHLQLADACVKRGGFQTRSEVFRTAMRHFEATHPHAVRDFLTKKG